MKDILHILRERERRVYVVIVTTHHDEPVVERRWFPTGIRADMARRNVGEFDGVEIRSKVGEGIFYLSLSPGPGVVQIRLESGWRTPPESHDLFEAAKPKAKRKGKIYWNMGEWWIHGVHGDEILTQVDLRPYAMM
jgi:hypothetical protein